MKSPINVLGTPLFACSLDPKTGWYRDGCCNTDVDDVGSHTVCAQVTDAFLEFIPMPHLEIHDGFELGIAGVFQQHVSVLPTDVIIPYLYG